MHFHLIRSGSPEAQRTCSQWLQTKGSKKSRIDKADLSWRELESFNHSAFVIKKR